MIRLSVPGKTFFLGEYLALRGGPSLVLATEPRFELVVSQTSESSRNPDAAKAFSNSLPANLAQNPFHSESPAGKFWQRYSDLFSTFEFEFFDPYQGAGGFGASSAQWALLFALTKWLEQKEYPDSEVSWSWEEILQVYRECAWNGRGEAPSGADVVAQLSGGLTWFDGREFQADVLEWPFENLEFSLFHTGEKLATHEHLLEAPASEGKDSLQTYEESLRRIVEDATNAIKTKDEMMLLKSVAGFAEGLEKMGRVAPHTKNILQQLTKRTDEVLVAKGCGAMGSDVVLVLHRPDKANSLQKWAQEHRLKMCGLTSDLSAGLLVEETAPSQEQSQRYSRAESTTDSQLEDKR